MKKIVLSIFSIFILATSCQDVLEEEFQNPLQPSLETDELPAGLFTSMLVQWKFYIKDYGEWWWQNSGWGIPSYAQITNRYITPRYWWYTDFEKLDGTGLFNQSGFTWFNDYYLRIKNWALINDNLQELSGQEYDDNIVYFKLATVMKEWGALRNVNLFNSIPYFDALKGTQGEFYPAYDDPEAIYVAALASLKDVADTLESAYQAMSPEGKTLLTKQDVALGGDIDKWIKYTNALRLRYAVMLAGVDEQTARTHITEAIANLPDTDYSFTIPHVQPANDLPGGGTWHRGLFERAFATFMSNGIINRMNFHELEYEEDIDDPRLPVLALPTKHNDYRGISYDADAQTPIYDGGERYYPFADNIVASSEQNAKSMWSHITFTHNNMPADMFTLGEVDLLLAEVAAKNLVATGKSAGEHIKDAVIHSTDFWYGVNALSNYALDLPEPWLSLTHPDKPSAAIVDSYGEKVKNAFDAVSGIDNQMEIIMQQKYIHINLLRPYLLWGELRRTRHPKLEKFTFEGQVMAPSPERLMYPNSELDTNTDNFLEVQDQNNWTSPIFWRTDASSYYRDDYITFKTSTLPDFN